MTHDEQEEMTVEIENVHKTYLLGVEGVPALRCVGFRRCVFKWRKGLESPIGLRLRSAHDV